MRELLPNEAIRFQLRRAEEAGMHGEHAKALQMFRDVFHTLEQQDNPPLHLCARAHHGMGLALVFQGDVEEGLAHLGEAVHNDPQTHGYARDLARAYFRLGMMDKAKLWAKRANVLGIADEES